MIFFELLIRFLWLVSFDVLVGFVIWTFYKYIDLKYFSTFEISVLKEENEYLKNENKKINGTSTNFWNKGDKI